MTARRHSIQVDGTDLVYSCREDQDLLRAVEWCNRRGIPVGCRNGGCGVCRLKILSGRYETAIMSSRHVSREDAAAGYVLACRTRPRSDLVVHMAQKTIVTINKPGEF